MTVGSTNSQLPITQLPITNYQLPITNSQFPIPNSQFPIPNSQFPIFYVSRSSTFTILL
ncbi:MAG: hypothetical protein HC849_09505 [Oscillatoriales cyanobacterium RU_3_3]|nr:hypothetical protein [Oscillatoriales cyanobacterium RU_3_3]